jgi:hypothetical protein
MCRLHFKFLLLLGFSSAVTAFTHPLLRQSSLVQKRAPLPDPRPAAVRTHNPNIARRGASRFKNAKAAGESRAPVNFCSPGNILRHRFPRGRKENTTSGFRRRGQLVRSLAYQLESKRNAQGRLACLSSVPHMDIDRLTPRPVVLLVFSSDSEG